MKWDLGFGTRGVTAQPVRSVQLPVIGSLVVDHAGGEVFLAVKLIGTLISPPTYRRS